MIANNIKTKAIEIKLIQPSNLPTFAFESSLGASDPNTMANMAVIIEMTNTKGTNKPSTTVPTAISPKMNANCPLLLFSVFLFR